MGEARLGLELGRRLTQGRAGFRPEVGSSVSKYVPKLFLGNRELNKTLENEKKLL